MFKLTQNQLKALLCIATIENIGASTRMENAQFSNHEIAIFLSIVVMQPFIDYIHHLKPTIQPEPSSWASLPPLAKSILQFMQNINQATITDIIQATNAPRSTIKKHLNLLIDQKYLTRHGEGRAVWYTKA